ncbi:hypothetical protein [Kitasatospora phosalacinea]|uniref:HEAT repeat domain-containing protein n=1 Tax=Kitasatospora phosalacinea TaxID=2065 RepID=A0ABW6GMV6_9ACTN
MTAPPTCPAHGPGPDLAALVGRRLTGVVASWYSYEGERAAAPVVVWLRDDRGGCTFVGTGSDWCLIVADDRPHPDVDLGEWGRLDVRDAPHDTPFAPAPGPPRPGHPPGARPAHRPHRPRTRLPGRHRPLRVLERRPATDRDRRPAMTGLPHHRALLASVDWPSLEVPHPTDRLDTALLARMTGPDPAERGRALDRVFHLVDHQNTIYRATPPVARYLAAILGEFADAPRLRLLEWLGAMAYDADDACVAAMRWATGGEDDPDMREFRELRPELFAAVRPFLADPDPDVREAALVAALPLSEHPDLADLRPELVGHAERLLATSTDRRRRYRARDALRGWGRDTAALENTEDRAVRVGWGSGEYAAEPPF